MNNKKLNVEDAFAYQIQRQARLLQYHFKQIMLANNIDLSVEQWGVLNKLNLAKDNTVGQSELVDPMFRDKANITRMLQSMEKKQLVKRIHDEGDRRGVKVKLISKGLALHKKLEKIVVVERKKLHRGLSQLDFDAMMRVFGKLDSNLGESI